MALKEVIKTLALFVGYKIPNSSGETGTILDSYGDSMDNFNSGLSDAGNAIDKNKKKAKEWKNVLMSFDVANVMSDQSSSDSGKGSVSSGGGMSIDPKLLDALNKYKYLFDDVHMKAQDIRDELLKWADIANKSFKENIFEPIKNSWNKYGAGILNNLSSTFNNIKYLFSDIAKVISENWKPMFQEISDLSVSMLETVSLEMKGLSDIFIGVWDNGGNYLLENIMKFIKSCSKLGTSILDNFVKPIIDLFNSTLGKLIGTVIGKLLGLLGGILKVLSDLTDIISENKVLVAGLGGVFTTLYASMKIGQFVYFAKCVGGGRKCYIDAYC